MVILEEFKFAVNRGEIFVKDMDLPKFESKFPSLSRLTSTLRATLPNGYSHYLVDLIIHNQKPGMNTCRDVRWHIDGDYDKDNQYVLWVSGPNRTLFPETIPDLTQIPKERHNQNEFLEKLMAELPCFEVPQETPVRYDSKTPHKGVVCSKSGKRTFVRMMATNYIKPKFIVKENPSAKL